jgi:hypothetical protein
LNFFLAGAFFWSMNSPLVLSRLVQVFFAHRLGDELREYLHRALPGIVAYRFVRRHDDGRPFYGS